MSTGLTFGTISSLYGLNAGIIDRTQFSLLVTVVVLSAIVPTAIAERWYLPVAERGRGLGARRADCGEKVRRIRHRAHAFATTAGDRLHEQRVTDPVGDTPDLFVLRVGSDRIFGAWHDRDAGAPRGRPRGSLAAHERDGLG